MEARDASTRTLARDHVEIITAGSWMIPTFIIATIVGIAVLVVSGSVSAAWLRIPLIIFGVLVVLMAVGSLGFAVWGKYLGFPWHFTVS